ncbi:MAG: hypothetical protein JWR80_9658 [Bradyrhizobium sp.]|nr:hypothetical protein [Bradyrhizobium sp.]
MRGSAQLVSGRPDPTAHRAAWQGDRLSPVHPLIGSKQRELA